MTQSADVVVIGAGIVGAACAYALCNTGLDVHLVESQTPASGTSRACDGLILLWDKTPGAELELGLDSVRMWMDLQQILEGDFGYQRCGTLMLAEDEHDLASGKEKARNLGRFDIRSQLLNPKDLQALEPNLALDLAGGILFPDDASIDPRRAVLALIAAAVENGLTLHNHTRVIALRTQQAGERRITAVVTGQGELATPNVVCAAGVWSNQIAAMANINLPIQPRKGHVLVTEKIPGMIRHALLEGGYSTTVQSGSQELQVALVAETTLDGNLLLGSSRQFVGFDRSVSLKVVSAIASRAARFVPALKSCLVIRSYAGLRPWTPDHKPLIGPWEQAPGLFFASGHEGAGIGLAPVTGKLVSDWITGAELPSYAHEVLPDRFNRVSENKTDLYQ
jgi:glycine/D-amino acid oxidase-like deaminating enzyme